jgi:signal transduction histidine kinase
MPEFDHLTALLLDQSPACAWIVSRDGRFERVYGNAAGVFGSEPDTLAGQMITQLLSRRESRAWVERFSRVFSGESVSLRHTTGDTVWHITLFPLSEGGEIRYAGGLARETAEWHSTERQLRQTVIEALQTGEFERKMAAKFLHDNVGQNLTAFGLQLDLLRMDLEPGPSDALPRIAEMQHLIEGIMEEVREYSYKLNPSTVERAGLRPALDKLAVRMRDRFPGHIRMNVDPSLKVDPKIAPIVFRILQEAVENAVKHGACSSIEIAVKSTRGGLTLEVRDNGKGFDPSDLAGGRRGLGLMSMEHYAAQAGLELSIVSDRGTGTTVRAAGTRSA